MSHNNIKVSLCMPTKGWTKIFVYLFASSNFNRMSINCFAYQSDGYAIDCLVGVFCEIQIVKGYDHPVHLCILIKAFSIHQNSLQYPDSISP